MRNRYSRQVILYVGEQLEKTAIRLQIKLSARHYNTPCEIIKINPELSPTHSVYKTLSTLDAYSRIFICGHCSKGDSAITDGAAQVISGRQIADIFSNNVHPGQLIDSVTNQQATISVVACGAGINKQNRWQDRFADHLHNTLRLKGFRVTIKARTTMVETLADGSKRTAMLGQEDAILKMNAAFDAMGDELSAAIDNNPTPEQHQAIQSKLREFENLGIKQSSFNLHKQAGSKLLWCWDKEGKKIVKDAYSNKQRYFGIFTVPGSSSRAGAPSADEVMSTTCNPRQNRFK